MKKTKLTRANTPPQFTLVQHSAAGYKGDPQFAKAVEVCSLFEPKEIREVRMAGGLLFESYNEAALREYAENYPNEVKGLIPRCCGRFHRNKVQGLSIYIAPTDYTRKANER